MTKDQTANGGGCGNGGCGGDKDRTRCEIWTRVMGHHRSVSHFNIGKKSEHCSRQHFSETASGGCEFGSKF